MPNQSQQRVYVNFTSDEFDNIASDLFQVTGFDGVEAISELFRFEIDLLSTDPDIDLESLVGKHASLAITKDGEQRDFHGVIAIMEQRAEAQYDHYCYKAVLVPRLWLMSLSRQNQIYQEKTVPQIVQQEIVHGEFSGGILADDIDNRMAEDYLIRDYTVQYRESDLDFISRLMENEGIYYYFEHLDGQDKLVFCDQNSKLDEVLDENIVSYVPKSGLASFDEQAIHSFNVKQVQICNEIILKDHNYREPHLPMVGSATTSPKRSNGTVAEGLGYGRKYAYGDHFKSTVEGNNLARLRAEMELCKQHTCAGTSDALFFQAGKLIQVEDHYRASLNREYLITRIRHTGGQALPGVSAIGAGEAVDYQNEFDAIPSDIEFRPNLVTPKPKLYGFMNAIVDGAATSDRAQMDEHGRYKLIMPFDVSGTGDGKASRWVRKAESYGGQGTGMTFPLLKGTEVIWSCMDGDLDRPIITGVVPGTGHGANKSMVTAQNSTSNKIKTPGNIVIEMQDGKGSGSTEDADSDPAASSVLTTQDQNTRYYAAGPIDGIKPLLTEQQQMNGEKGDKGERGGRGRKGKDGTDGDSAFDLWYASNGNTGTQADYEASLKGDDGDSAFDLWYASNGNTGTQADYEASLKGDKGATGNSELSEGDSKISENDEAGDKWMNIAVKNYNAAGHNSYIRLGAVPKDTNIYQNSSHTTKSGMLLYTDGVYQQGADEVITKTSGITFAAGWGMKGSASAGYESQASLALKSDIIVGGSLQAKLAVDVGVSIGASIQIKRSYDHSIILKGYKYEEVKGPTKTEAKSIVLKTSGDAEVPPSIKKWERARKVNQWAIVGLAAATATTYAAAMGATKRSEEEETVEGTRKLTETDKAKDILRASLGLTVATMASGVLEAGAASKINAAKQKDISESAIISMDNNSITLSCDGSSIVISGDGVFINGKSFVVGGLPKGIDKFNPGDDDISSIVIPRVYPDHVVLNARGTVDLRAKQSISLTSNKDLAMKDLPPAPTVPPAPARDAPAALPKAAIGPEGTQLTLNQKDKGVEAFKVQSTAGITIAAADDSKFNVNAKYVNIVATGEAHYYGKPAYLGKNGNDVGGNTAAYKASGE
jgi:type VI secretion system VgrG family protein